MRYVLLSMLVLASFFSCKKSKIETVNTNNSKDSLTYQPRVPGSKWTYEMTIAVVNKTTYNTTRLTYDTVINGKTYQAFNSEAEGNQFIRQDGDKYYSVLTSSTTKMELLILDASKNVNETWIGGVNGDDQYSYTMKEKFPVFTLDGFTFKNVLKVYQERKNTTTNNVTLTSDNYYAQGVGMVQSEGTLNSIPVKVKVISVDLK